MKFKAGEVVNIAFIHHGIDIRERGVIVEYKANNIYREEIYWTKLENNKSFEEYLSEEILRKIELYGTIRNNRMEISFKEAYLFKIKEYKPSNRVYGIVKFMDSLK